MVSFTKEPVIGRGISCTRCSSLAKDVPVTLEVRGNRADCGVTRSAAFG
jgi:hypothetical protein